MNIFDWVRRHLFLVGSKSRQEILFEISALTEGLSRAVRQIAEIHQDLPTVRFIENSLGQGLLGKIDGVNSSLRAIYGDIQKQLESMHSRLTSIEIELASIKGTTNGDENAEEE